MTISFFKRAKTHVFFLTGSLVFGVIHLQAQTNNLAPVTAPDTTKTNLLQPVTQLAGADSSLTLKQCIDYAMIHQPGLNQSLINISIARQTNAINLATWLPQVNASGDLIHYIQSPKNGTTVAAGGGTTTGGTTTTTPTTGVSSKGSSYANSFIPGVTVSQNIFTPSLLYASRSAPLYIKQAQQVTDSTKIFLVTSVTKSFYNVLLTLEQINVLKEDTTRLGKSLRDAYHQYKGGIVDETDYEEAAITLNNSMAQLKQANENVIPQYASLKQLMGYPPQKQFNVSFDTVEMAGRSRALL
jgi:outer membrane protein TolC